MEPYPQAVTSLHCQFFYVFIMSERTSIQNEIFKLLRGKTATVTLKYVCQKCIKHWNCVIGIGTVCQSIWTKKGKISDNTNSWMLKNTVEI